MANFDSSLTSPYQQLVPERALDADSQPDVWGASGTPSACTRTNRPCIRAPPTTEVRLLAFLYVDRSDVISHIRTRSTIRRTSPTATYKSTLEQVKKTKSTGSCRSSPCRTMPYHKWYKHNDFKATSTTDKPLKDDEQESIETYQKGALR